MYLPCFCVKVICHRKSEADFPGRGRIFFSAGSCVRRETLGLFLTVMFIESESVVSFQSLSAAGFTSSI